jgi:outer membrane protein OmpA-like peptidoglycan-associated protein
MRLKQYTVILFMVLGMKHSYAQISDSVPVSRYEREANLAFDALNYIKAIVNYETVLRTDTHNLRVLPKLAKAYYLVNDYRNALRIYDSLVTYNKEDAEYAFTYAKLLAMNGHYEDALNWFEKANTLSASDHTKEMIHAYQNIKQFHSGASHKEVRLANINSERAEFSPMFYKDGLLFCSNRTSSDLVKRVSEWDQMPFTNIFYISDSTQVKEATGSDTIKIVYNDDNTYETSNDTKIGGFHSFSYNERDTNIAHVKPTLGATKYSALCSRDHDGPFSFFHGQDSLILTRTNKNKANDGTYRIALYKAVNKNGKWKVGEPLDFIDNNVSYANPALSPDNKVLYFVSDQKGGMGGTDIYKSVYTNGTWSKPENMGKPINTEGNEQFPYIDTMGVLYFSSDGHPGLGGLDLFMFTNGKVENMGYPINSSYDDFGMTLDNTCGRGFLSSNRRRGFSDDDIFILKMDPKAPLQIRVVDSSSQELIPWAKDSVGVLLSGEMIQQDSSATGSFTVVAWDGEVYSITANAQGYRTKTLEVKMDVKQPVVVVPLVKEGCSVGGVVIDKDTRVPVPSALVVICDTLSQDTLYRVYVGADGAYSYANLKSNRVYAVSVRKEGYYVKRPYYINTQINDQCLIPVDTGYNYNHDFELEQIILGKAIKIDNIYFALGSAKINKSSALELDKIVELMQGNPDIVIELSSHTDCRGYAKSNLTLSDKRAKSSADYIISKGIAAERIIGKGYGETRLLNDCGCEGKKVTRKCTESEHAINRRTEFQVTGFLSKDTNKKLRSGEMDTEIKKEEAK